MKSLSISLFLLSLTQLVLAQSVHFGVKGGLNEAYIAGLSPTNNTKGYLRPGFHAGAFAEFKFKKWSVEPGLFFTVKGYKATANTVQTTPGGTFNISISGTQTYQYIELPMNVFYNIKVKPGKMFIGGGPYMGYLLSAMGKRNTTTNGTNVYTETKFDIGGDGNFKRNDFGLGGTLGMEFKNGLLFSAGTSFGFTNIVIHNINNNPSVTKNRVLSFSVGYIF